MCPKNSKPSYLETTSEYFILTNNQEICPRLIEKLYVKFNVVLRKIHNRTRLEIFEKADCKEFVKQVDEILELAGEITQRARLEDKKHLDKLKRKLWHLLETLEKYCKKNFKISIW